MIYFWNKPLSHIWSGGNNFLSNLRQYLDKQSLYTPQRSAASTILVDSYHNLISALGYKLIDPRIHFIYRFGPIFHLHRSSAWKLVDNIMIIAANYCADFVIFQSNWSLEQARGLGFKSITSHVVIYNGVDTNIFKKNPHSLSSKIKLIATSWSNNLNKGFTYLEYLDNHLDWTKYEMTFVGNSPVSFKNIRMLSPLPAVELASILQKQDIYIAAMKNDACSNALLEALACGLPVVALDSGANCELVGNGGILFNSDDDLIPALEKIVRNYSTIQQESKTFSIEKAGEEYVKAINKTHTQPASLIQFCKILALFLTFLIRR